MYNLYTIWVDNYGPDFVEEELPPEARSLMQALLMNRATHVLPIVEDGKQVCPGSPSRAQYIEGQPRDPRPEFAYDAETERMRRAGWERLQRDKGGNS
ncbi:hypothetical protein HY734_00435 [Candidatus Uhrbacteria bacterium]|nr:hypothetical protein [Candidatus Uhrbacteria bacterium]